jgi:putative selenate reductase
LKILQLKQATRDYGVKIPEKAPEDRLNFDLFIDTLSEEMAVKEATRCLQCDIFCNICTTVCPNRSNMYYEVQPSKIPLQKAVKYDDGKVQILNTGTKLIDQPYQIINIGDFCNECGNCTTFCPSAGDPYKDKPKFHLTEESFDCANFGFYFAEENLMKIKTEYGISTLRQKNNIFEYEDNKIKVIFNNFSAETIEFKQSDLNEIKLEAITDYIFLFKNLKNKIH